MDILHSRLYLSEWLMPGIRNFPLSVFFIMLSTIRVSFIFSILVYSRRAIKYVVQREFYYKVMISDQYYSTSFEELYSRKYRRCLYSNHCSVNLRDLPIVLHILIGIISTHVPFVFILPLIEIARTQFFVRWMECNTMFPEYVLKYIFKLFDHIF